MFFSKIRAALDEQKNLLIAVAKSVYAHSSLLDKVATQQRENQETLRQSLEMQSQIVEILSRALNPHDMHVVSSDTKKKDYLN